LMELAMWCQRRLEEGQGEDPCTTPRTNNEQAKKKGASSRPEATLEGTADLGAKRDRTASGADDDSKDPSSKARGGIQ
jgi:hypothetical protein